MTKADIVEKVHERTGFSKKESSEAVAAILEILKEKLENGQKVKLSGFGNFVIRRKDVRKGRNPKTGEEMEISARKVMSFKPSQKLKDYINSR
ncbi:MAG TPA: integration host factor subunit alpha [Proteobacteria bacterium]|nr:integration host factor subunit alpha [bacterium BMS3Abin14]HDL53612.1 integration host factor subunit alpha [Pseudomonadota bacterium]